MRLLYFMMFMSEQWVMGLSHHTWELCVAFLARFLSVVQNADRYSCCSSLMMLVWKFLWRAVIQNVVVRNSKKPSGYCHWTDFLFSVSPLHVSALSSLLLFSLFAWLSLRVEFYITVWSVRQCFSFKLL